MTIKPLRLLAPLALGSIWLGLEIDPRRDYIAWLFIVIAPLMIVALAVYLSLRRKKNITETKENAPE